MSCAVASFTSQNALGPGAEAKVTCTVLSQPGSPPTVFAEHPDHAGVDVSDKTDESSTGPLVKQEGSTEQADSKKKAKGRRN